MQLTTIMAFLIPVAVATHQHKTLLKNILNTKENLFTKVNNDVEHVMNNLFGALDLTTTFLRKPRVQLLLTMHYDLKTIAERNYDVYQKYKNVTKLYRNQTSNKVELFDLIEEILNDKHLNLLARSTDKPDRMHKSATSKSANVTDSEFNNSEEFTKFIEAFINKVDNLSVKDFIKKTPMFRTAQEEDKYSKYNLEVWEPSPELKLESANDTYGRRMYLGKRGMIVDYPFIASIHLLGVFACAGSIIASDLIITAASCLQLLHNNRFFRENPRDLYVRIGSDSLVLGGEIIYVLEVYFYPSYEPNTLKNNLAILRLQKTIRFRELKTKMRRILFDKKPSHLPANTDGIIALGWGARKPNQVVNAREVLRVAQLDLYHINECTEIYSDRFVTTKHFCAGFISKGGGACNKDVGGPGVVGGELVGVISFGPPVCGAIDAPTVFTKLGYYAKWITSIVQMARVQSASRTTVSTHQKVRRPIGSFTTSRKPIAPINTEDGSPNHWVGRY